MMKLTSLFGCVALMLAGCNDDNQRGAAGAGMSGAGGSSSVGELPKEGCNPIGSGDCMLPYPSAMYLKDDASSSTGVRVDFKMGQLPANDEAVPVDPARWNFADGFPAAAPALALFPEGVDPANLPTHADLGAGIAAESPTAIIEIPSGRRLVHFAELDANYVKDERQALIIRPLERPASSSRYAVILRKSLRARHGGPIAMPPGFAAIVLGQATSNVDLERLRKRYDAIFAAADKAGIPKDDILLAWDYVTASDAYVLGPIRSMRDTALTMAGPDGSGLTYAIDQVMPGTGGVKFTLRGHFQAPQFLTKGGTKEGVFEMDEAGLPKVQGTQPHDVPFSVIVPSRVDTEGPLPIMVWGHGLLGKASTGGDGYPRQFAVDKGYIVVATDWTGLTGDDFGTIVFALAEATRMPWISDKLAQSVINTILLTRLAKGPLAADPMLQNAGRAMIDATRIYYYGVSLGGIMGSTLMAWTPDIQRGALGVPGGNWSLLIERSTYWPSLYLALSGAYPDAVDQLKLLGLLQAQFDFFNPINVKPLYTENPKRLLLYEARHDCLVANLSTEMLARTLGVAEMSPAINEVYGMTQAPAPLESALTTWDEQLMPYPPADNLRNDEDNGTHGSLPQRPAVRRLVAAFLTDTGMIGDPCRGQACDCTAPMLCQ